MLPVLKVKQILDSDVELQREIRLLAAERNFPALAKFDFNNNESSSWVLLNDNNYPIYFAHAHNIVINDKLYIRVMSKTAQLSKRSTFLPDIPGRGKYVEPYCLLYHHIKWANLYYPDIPTIITASVEFNEESPRSDTVFKFFKSGKCVGIDPNYFLSNIHKKSQGIFNIESEKIAEVYNQILKTYQVELL